METKKAPSEGFYKLIANRDDASEVRLHARAKEASAITRLLRVAPKTLAERAQLESRLGDLEAELRKSGDIPITDDPTDFSDLLNASDIFTFSEVFDQIFSGHSTKRFKLKDVVSAIADSRAAAADTRHQDAKDIERDAILIGQSTVTLHGSNVGYDGIVKAVAEEVAKTCNERADDAALIRFTRILINAANRTTSGGDAFETIDKFFKPGHLVFLAPDSVAPLEPLKIACKRGIFRTSNGWDWGVCAYTEATSKYLLFEIDDVDRVSPLARIQGTCIRKFALGLPIPKYDDARVFADDGKSIGGRSFYEIDDGGIIEISGTWLR